MKLAATIILGGVVALVAWWMIRRVYADFSLADLKVCQGRAVVITVRTPGGPVEYAGLLVSADPYGFLFKAGDEWRQCNVPLRDVVAVRLAQETPTGQRHGAPDPLNDRRDRVS